jgi:hypothetical protein
MQRVYEMGRATGEKYLSRVQEYLASGKQKNLPDSL